MLVVFTSTPTMAEAESLAKSIIAEKLAACVQVLPQMTSFYFWEGKIQREPEHLLLIKSVEEKYGELEEFIKKNHSYEVPEIVAVKSDEVSESYQNWLASYLRETPT